MVLAGDATEQELWSRYRQRRDTHARERLFAHYAPWARSVALSVHRRVWGYAVERSDCVQNAAVGLLEAMERYDPDRGIEFRMYAARRVRGAVFNGLRVLIGDRSLGPSAGRFQERLADLNGPDDADAFDSFVSVVVGLGVGVMLESMNTGLVDERDGLEFATACQVNNRLRTALSELGERHRVLIEAHYFHFLPFNELAAHWGITKGRVSQLHKEALLRLRRALTERS
jgi:RNA polymerase sigma factor for flagellar operon FliA